MKQSDGKYLSKKEKEPKRNPFKPLVLIVILVLIGIAVSALSGGAFAKPSSNIKSDFAFLENSNNPQCPYETTFVKSPSNAQMETTLRLDLSHGGTAHFVTLVVPSSNVAFLTDGTIKLASSLKVGDSIYMTGDKIGTVLLTEQNLYSPQSISGYRRGNVYSRVIGKSERYVETILNIDTANEVITTTPEHPFYVNGDWVEAQYLRSGDEIRTKTGEAISVDHIEIKHDPQMVYSLLIEGTHNFYVGEDGLLAHNCTPQLGKKLEYIFGKATGSQHNIERSVQMQNQLASIGIFDNAEGRAYMADILSATLSHADNIVKTQDNGRVVRETLIEGPNGLLKMESIWEGDKLITANLFGK